MKDFRTLQVWRKAHDLTLSIYAVTRQFPREELYGLTSQMRRCSASIAANMAEGCGKDTDGEFGRFLQIASGSARELEYHLLLARDLGFMPAEKYGELQQNVGEVQRMLRSLLDRMGKRTVAAGQANG
jgi:four helix bundle protein